MKCLFLLTIFMIFQAFAEVKNPKYDDLEGLDLVEALIVDQNYELAEQELKTYKNKNARFYYLKGRLNFSQEKWDSALKEFVQAQKFEDPMIRQKLHRLMAISESQLKNWSGCSDFFAKTDELNLNESDFIVKSRCLKKINKFPEAWSVLQKAQTRWGSFYVETEKLELLLELKLSAEAESSVFDWFKRHKGLPSQYQAIAEIFLNQGYASSALQVIELGRMAYPTHLDLNLIFAQMYFQKKQILTSVEGFISAALIDPKYMYHAAETFRQLQMFSRSQYFNQFIGSSEEKLKQLMALYIDQAQYAKIASLENAIMRSDLYRDDEIRYALAYSMALGGEIESPLKYLATIQKPELIEKTTLLRKTLLDCKAKSTHCQM